jgi:rhodanese-related sulfurtransferase
MSGPNTCSLEKLARLIGTPGCPAILEVRSAEDFAADPRLIPTSRRMDYSNEAAFDHLTTGVPVVVTCQKGLKLSEGVAALLRLRGIEAASLAGGFLAWRDAGLPLMNPQPLLGHGKISGTRWVTRHRPKIDRIACPWLLRRFVDPEAEFLYVTPDQVEAVGQRFNAIPFDMESGLWTHENGNCTFDKMLAEFGLRTEPLLRLAEIVRCADTNRLADNPQAAGLLAISIGLSRMYGNDLEQLQAGLSVYDALYRWCRDGTDETHSWPARSKS